MGRTIARRAWLKGAGAAGVGFLVPGGVRASQSQAQMSTPPQTQGPFYPVKDQADTDVDLTRVQGRSGTAVGTPIRLEGSIRSVTGAPLGGAMIEIWQACASGRYDHPGDRNPAPLDPDFQYWGRITTDADGRYGFRTIKPGAYPNDPTWMRPPHVHVRVVAESHRTLTTQMYFEGESLNDEDRILRALTPAQRALVVVPFVPAGTDRTLRGQFDIVLGDPADPRVTPDLD